MLEKLLKLYTMSMRGDVRSPLPHVVGPPGCGKSTTAQELADLVGKKLHIINVSRMSPLEIEGVQMPRTTNVNDVEQMFLQMLHSTIWTSLEEGDVVLFDEFLRGFPESYNGLLDIFTSRHVAGLNLPRVFIMAASNSVTTYDRALTDRLLNLPVDDPRKRKSVRTHMAGLLVKELGLLPAATSFASMEDMLTAEVLPMFNVLDSFDGKGVAGGSQPTDGHSLRNLIGQAKLREVQSAPLLEVIEENNRVAMTEGKTQCVFLISGKNPPKGYESKAKKIMGDKTARSKLTEIQALNLELNLQLIELEEIRRSKGTDSDDTDVFVDGE